MNRAMKSVVEAMPPESEEYPLVQNLCFNSMNRTTKQSWAVAKWSTFRRLLVKVRCFEAPMHSAVCSQI